MKNIFAKTTAIITAAAALSACNLDLYPKGSIVYEEDKPIFKSEEDIAAFSNSIYVYFRACQGGTYAIAEELMFDHFNATLDYGNNYGAIHCLNSSFTASDSYVESYWGQFFTAINRYNDIIASAGNVDESLKESAKYIAAEAFAARAYSYMQLARHFGPAYNAETADKDLCVPLVVKNDLKAKPERATMKAVYDQIKADLDTAATTFTEFEVAGKVASMYFNIDIINAMYARYYLDTKDYGLAASTAAALIDKGTYTLCSTKEDLEALCFDDDGTEPLMQLYVSKTESPNGFGIWTSYGQDSDSPTGYAFQPLYIPSKVLVDSYKSTDIRRQVWLHYTEDDPIRIGSKFLSNIFVFTKFWGNPSLSSSGLQTGVSAPKPFKIGEMYLIAAEAYLQANNPTKSLEYLKALQSARSAGNTKATLANIQKEWNKETIGEGLILSNMKRWGLGFDGRACQDAAADFIVSSPYEDFDGKTLEAGDFHLVWPVPTYEMKVNPNLVQNSGYASVN